MSTWTKEIVSAIATGSSVTIGSVRIDGVTVGHTDNTDLLTLASGQLTIDGDLSIGGGNILSALTCDSTLTSTGLLTATAGLKLGNNIIYASDGGTAITLDTDSKVTFADDVKLAATKKLYLDGGGDVYFHVLADNDILQLSGGLRTNADASTAPRLINMTPNGLAGNGNTVYGSSTGENLNSSSQYNTFFGFMAGDSATDNADSNSAFGYIAMSQVTTGDHNTAIGKATLYEVTTGSNNVALGSNSLDNEQQGSASVGIGVSALTTQRQTSAVSTYNVAVGFNAGFAISTGTKNILVGAKAGEAITTGGKNICIGYNTETSSNNTSNEIVIGDDITGLGANKIVLGHADQTDAYIGADSGTTVHCGAVVHGLAAVAVSTSTLAYASHSVSKGKYVTVSADAQTITLPAVQIGAAFIIVNVAADGGALLTISPNAGDMFLTDIAGGVGTNDKDIINTKATMNQGDFVKIVGMSADGWAITEIGGIWVDQA